MCSLSQSDPGIGKIAEIKRILCVVDQVMADGFCLDFVQTCNNKNSQLKVNIYSLCGFITEQDV